jgi:two-component system, LytTR family, sensor kinase
MSASRRWAVPLWAFAFFTFMGLSKCAHFWLDDLSRGHPGTFARRLIEELSGAWAMALVFILLAWVVRRYPLEPGRILSRLPGYVALVLLTGLLHTTLMWWSRLLVFPLVGMGTYDYGIMQYRYPMELAAQVPDILLLTGALHAWRWYQRTRDARLQAERLESELNRARLERLEAQLEPHFLFNTLNVASSLMYTDPGRADRMLGRLADLLRLTFQRPAEPEVTLAEELEWLGWYLEIMQVRFGDRLTVRQVVPPETLDCGVPRLLLQPLVENALKHGPGRRSGPATVSITARLERNTLRLAVQDDGPGLAGPAADRGGVGLANTRARLEALYGGEGRLSLHNRPGGGLSAEIELPARHLPARVTASPPTRTEPAAARPVVGQAPPAA